MCVKPDKLKFLARYRLICALGAVVYNALLLRFSYEFFFNFLTNWGNIALLITFSLLAYSHFRQGHYRCGSNMSIDAEDGWFWKLVVLCYELTVIMVTMITICYWVAIFPTDLVLPDNVKKPGFDRNVDIDLQLTKLEQACTIYYMDRYLTTENFLMKPTPEFIA